MASRRRRRAARPSIPLLNMSSGTGYPLRLRLDEESASRRRSRNRCPVFLPASQKPNPPLVVLPLALRGDHRVRDLLRRLGARQPGIRHARQHDPRERPASDLLAAPVRDTLCRITLQPARQPQRQRARCVASSRRYSARYNPDPSKGTSLRSRVEKLPLVTTVRNGASPGECSTSRARCVSSSIARRRAEPERAPTRVCPTRGNGTPCSPPVSLGNA